MEGRGDGVLGMRHYGILNNVKCEVLSAPGFKLTSDILPHWRSEVLADIVKCLESTFGESGTLTYIKEKYGIGDPEIGGPILYVYRMFVEGIPLDSSYCLKHRAVAFEMAAFHWVSSIRPKIVTANELRFIVSGGSDEELYGLFLLWCLDLGLDLRSSISECFEPMDHFTTFKQMLKTVEDDRTKRAACKMAKA